MSQIPDTYNRDCAYVNGFPVLDEGCDVVLLRNYAKYVFMSFWRKNSGWKDMWGLNSQQSDRLRWKTFAIGWWVGGWGSTSSD